jgi:hypothetical protein
MWDLEKMFEAALIRLVPSEKQNLVRDHSAKHRCITNLRREINSCGKLFDRLDFRDIDKKQKAVNTIVDTVVGIFAEAVLAEKNAILTNKGFTKMRTELDEEVELAEHVELAKKDMLQFNKPKIFLGN